MTSTSSGDVRVTAENYPRINKCFNMIVCDAGGAPDTSYLVPARHVGMLDGVEHQLSLMSDNDIDVLCTGEHTDQLLVMLKYGPRDVWPVDALFGLFFDGWPWQRHAWAEAFDHRLAVSTDIDVVGWLNIDWNIKTGLWEIQYQQPVTKRMLTLWHGGSYGGRDHRAQAIAKWVHYYTRVPGPKSGRRPSQHNVLTSVCELMIAWELRGYNDAGRVYPYVPYDTRYGVDR